MFDKLRSFFTKGTSTLGGSQYNASFWSMILNPSADFDYRKAAGQRYDNGTVGALIGFFSRVWGESDLVVAERRYEGTEMRHEIIRDHPFYEVYKDPLPDYDASGLWAGALLSLICDGSSYWYKRRNPAGEFRGLQYVPHYQIFPRSDGPARSDGRLVTHYEYLGLDGDRQLLPVEDVAQMKWGINPQTGGRTGLSPTAAVLREIATDNELTTYSAAVCRNLGIPSYIISPKSGRLSDMGAEARERLKRTFIESTTGENRGMPLVPPIPIDATRLSLTPSDLAFESLAAFPLARICSAIGIDPMVLGYPSPNKTYSNYEEALRAAYHTCIIPLKRQLSSQLTRSLLHSEFEGSEHLELWWDFTDVWVLKESQTSLFDTWSNAYQAGWVKRSDARSAVGLPTGPEDDVYREETSDMGTSDDDRLSRVYQSLIGRRTRRSGDPDYEED